MRFLGIEFGRRKKRNKTPVSFKAPPVKKEDQTPTAPKKTILIAKIPRVKNPVLSFKLRPGADEFEQPEYDMAEIGRIEDVEAYVQRAFTQKEGLMFKEDWEAVGKNLQTIKYIKQRFEQFGAATGEPFATVLRGAGEDLIRYSNAFLVKVRNRKASGGKLRKVPGKKKALEPVAGYFAIPVSTVRFKRDDNGKVLKYRQLLPNGRYKDFNPDDVIHIYFRKKKGFLVGTPSLIPVKDDIRALRRIEENIEMLIYQHLFPLYHYQVGTEDAPAREYADGTREIDVVKTEVEIMPAEGMIVTPERHTLSAVGAEGRALRAEGYLNHFKQRIFAGLGVSAIDMGEGDTANRSTADSMSRNMVDDVKHYQRTWELAVNEYIIKELLLESTFGDPIDDENIVTLKFNEIDVEAKIKVESHAIDSFGGHAITQTELRRAFGKEPLTEEERDDTFWKLIEEPRIMMQSIDEPYSALAQAVARAASTSPDQEDFDYEETERKKELEADRKAKAASKKPGPKTTKKSSGQRAARAKTRPSNQHGTKSSPEKRKSSFVWGDMVAPGNRITKLYTDLQENAMHAIETGAFGTDWFKQLALATGTMMQERLLRLTRIDFRSGFRSTKARLDSDDLPVPFSVLESRTQRIINRFVAVLVDRIGDNFDPNDTPDISRIKVVSVFDALKFRSRFIYNSERNKARNYGILRGLRKLGYFEADLVDHADSCELCKSLAGRIDITNATIDDVPGFHPNCTCTIVQVERQENQ
jgi:hypothetical protein